MIAALYVVAFVLIGAGTTNPATFGAAVALIVGAGLLRDARRPPPLPDPDTDLRLVYRVTP